MINPYNEFLKQFFNSYNDDKSRLRRLNRLIYENKLEEVEEKLQKDWDYHMRDSYGLSPWHIAAMTNNQQAALLLFRAKIWDINICDNLWCTAMHHAAVAGHITFIHFLKSHGASDKLCNLSRGTPQDLLQQCHRAVDPRAQTFWIKQNDEIVEKNGEEFAQLTHATLIEEDVVDTPAQWIKRWRKDVKEPVYFYAQTEFVGKTLQCYQAFRPGTAPKVYLDHDPKIGYFLRAGEKIPPFTMMGEYLGEVLDEDETNKRWAPREREKRRLENNSEDPDAVLFNFSLNSRYHYSSSTSMSVKGSIDAYAKRGFMAMMACSFPNVFEDFVSHQRGQRQRVIFFSCEEIEKDAPLVTDYGREHMVKKMAYVELREKEMFDFFKDKDYDQLQSMLKKPETSQFSKETDYLTALANHQRARYLLNTPQALLTLRLKDSLKVSLLDLRIKYSHPCFIDDFMYRLNFQTWLWDAAPPETVKQIKEELLAAVKTHTLLDIYKLLEDKYNVLLREYYKDKKRSFG